MENVETRRRWRGPLLAIASSAAIGGILAIAVGLPAIWRLSRPYAVTLALLVVIESIGLVWALARVRRLPIGMMVVGAAGIAALWALSEECRILPAPDPFLPLNSTVGIGGWLCAGLQLLVVATTVIRLVLPMRTPGRSARLIGLMATAPLLTVVVLLGILSVVTAGSGFRGPSIPATTRPVTMLPAGRRSTVEYCRPGGVPLPMDLYLPRVAATSDPAPVALYVHGGGLVIGDRRTSGLGAQLAGHDGALFIGLQRRLNASGFVVASIDYRLTPGSDWRAPLSDAKCAVRFLRAHADELGVDPSRIGVWGSSAGGQLASLLGLVGPSAGFDRGQYADRSSAVQAVVDMFGPPDVARYGDAGPFVRMILSVSLGDSPRVRRAMSPASYVRTGAPPFLILQGRRDSAVLFDLSVGFSHALRAAGGSATMVAVDGAGHGLDAPGQRPSPSELTDQVVRFFRTSLG
ncbi:alpha/beta hydrolase [Microlunatus soli]|nr:alpha/beta hydrolase [Microlunatus soli]